MSETVAVPQRYHYFDTPDGQDLTKKLWCVSRVAVPISGIIALGDVMLFSYPKGYLNIGLRMAAVSLPMIGIAGTFVVATNSLASIREKDDRLNWFLGGFIAGSCVGLWRRNRMMGFNVGMLGGILATVRKEMAIQGWAVTPLDNRSFRPGGATTCLADFSITKERPRNWTTGSS